MLKRFKTEIYTYYKMFILALISIAGIVLMGRSEVAQNLFSGLAIFLLGMLFLEDGFKGFSGGALEKILKNFSNIRLKAILFGLSATAIMQSSTLVTILTLSFLSASLVGLGQALGIVFGANIGSTTSGWIIAGIGVKMNVSALGLPLITLGVLLLLMKSKNLKSLGYILAGIGFFFLGIAYIKTGFESYQNFDLNVAARFGGFWAFLIFFGMGVLITSIVQSSFATLTIIILALSSGSISYNDALALVIGTNVGGVVTALIASISSSVDGRRLAIGNTLFNVVIAIVCMVFLPVFKEIVELASSLFGFKSDDYALKIALFHTIYNVIAVLLMTPFIPMFEAFLCKFITTSKDDSDRARYIDFDLIPYPNTAKECLQKEVLHLFGNTITILSAVIGTSKQRFFTQRLDMDYFTHSKTRIDADKLENIYEKTIKNIFNSIIDFSTHLRAAHHQDQAFCAEIGNLQKASRNLVEATKNLKIIQSSLIKNANSSNAALKDQYTQIRILLANTLYDLKHLQDQNSPKAQTPQERTQASDNIQEGIKTIKKNLKKTNAKSINTIQDLIKDRTITSAQATSLLNDIAFSTEALKEIVTAANCIVKYENLLLKQEDEQDNTPKS
ncbi:Na/Pi cotransporter family protein [Helicobacter zhangjianzhongii]|uniref:Na/Pi symporter n=1 Tax=Helicobacter zhangjianzhongii TaxID=2974574 RepID=A0ACC6FUQ9_9HELI|nr:MULTISPECIES: Na/Pi symporter [unclassified Helicobacter]MDL0080840.1 Na/Pi symporter [Helicobacter sp. CPD2-1]MDL0082887.1 Na/Pi symporter [Helicobacter sp. XJK30-2]